MRMKILTVILLLLCFANLCVQYKRYARLQAIRHIKVGVFKEGRFAGFRFSLLPKREGDWLKIIGDEPNELSFAFDRDEFCK